jgi:ABC-type branched-subunit amino acid transport system substrate-binding protein
MVRTKWGVRLFAGVAALALVAAACGGDDDDDESTDTTAAAEEGADVGALSGMQGTTPLVELSDDFTSRLLEKDPSLGTTFNYAAESYDAVVISALAAQIAGDDGSAHADQINGVTRDGEKCETYADCLALVQAGTDIDYDGVSGPGEFSGNGEPTEASYGVLVFGDDNRIDNDATEFIAAQAPPEADVEQVPVAVQRAGDGVLKFGALLPQTGNLAFLGPPMFAGTELAIDDVNAAGGYNGQPVQFSEGDSGDTSTDLASQTVDRLLSESVDVIIGAASSGVTLTVIDKITAAGVTQFSPANTSKTLSTYDDKGLYFRTAPSDILQGQVLGERIAEDGNTSLVILNLDDAYGNGLAEDVTASFESAGGEVLDDIVYDPQAQTFDSEVQTAADADADAYIVIGFDESSRILSAMVEAGIGPNDVAVWGCDGNMGDPLGENFDAGE